MQIVRLYTCESFDEHTQRWTRSRHRYTLEQISGFANSRPVLDDFEDVERADEPQITAYFIDPPKRR